MMRRFLLVLLLVPMASLGQEAAQPDTLDWKGYWPLAVGNLWETDVNLFVKDQYDQLIEVVGDTVINGTSYFVLYQIRAGLQNCCADGWVRTDVTRYLRYDEPLKGIAEYFPDGDIEHMRVCDLDNDMGIQSLSPECEAQSGLNESFGTYPGDDLTQLRVGEEEVQVAALKEVQLINAFGMKYYHGIGELEGIGDGVVGEIKFNYVKVGGVEYGTRTVFTNAERDVPAEANTLQVFPNPARSLVRVERSTPHAVQVFDPLGRLVEREAGMSRRHQLNVATWPAGVYVVVSDDLQGRRLTKTFVKP